MSNIAILIPAAGASLRMGTPKQLLKWEKTTLLGHSIEMAQGTQSDIFVVLGAHFEEINASIKKYSVHVFNNNNWQKGLGNSIAFGIGQILQNQRKFDAILIMLADQPMIATDYLNKLINTYKTDKNQIVASKYENGKHGVPVLFDRFYFDELSKLKNDIGAKSLLKKYADNVTSVDALLIHSDIDTIQDYDKLYSENHKNLI